MLGKFCQLFLLVICRAWQLDFCTQFTCLKHGDNLGKNFGKCDKEGITPWKESGIGRPSGLLWVLFLKLVTSVWKALKYLLEIRESFALFTAEYHPGCVLGWRGSSVQPLAQALLSSPCGMGKRIKAKIFVEIRTVWRTEEQLKIK